MPFIGMRIGAPGSIGRGAPPATPRVAGSTVAYAIGDSRTSQNIENTYNFSARGSGADWARRLSAGRLQLPITNIAASSGYTAAQIRASHYVTAKASAAKVLILLAGVNFGASDVQDLADVTYMAQDFAGSASDRVVFIYDEMPPAAGSGWDGTAYGRHVALRNGIRALSNPAAGIYVVPTWLAFTGDDGNTPTAGLFIADGVHPTIPGAFLLGQTLKTAFDAVIPAFNPYTLPTFVVGAARSGANFTGATGNTLAANGLAAANVVSSRMVVDGSTTWAELTLNGTTSASCNPSGTTLVGTGITAGVSMVSSIIKVKLHAGVTNICAIELKQIKQSAAALGVNAGFDMQHQGGAFEIGEIPAASDVFLTLQTPPVLVNADATQARWQILFHAESVGAVAQAMVGLVSVAYGGMIIH